MKIKFLFLHLCINDGANDGAFVGANDGAIKYNRNKHHFFSLTF
jgi:hypothetical protein